jgi:hypothetical protein
VGMAVTAMGQMAQGKTANKIAQRNAEIQTRNAKLAKDNAKFNADLRRRRGKDERGIAVNELGAGGTVVYDGSNQVALAEQEFVTDLEAQVIERGGTIDSDNLLAQAQITSAQGQAAETAGNVAAGSTLLTGSGTTALNFATFKKG